MKKTRRVTESDAIAEFLKNEFYRDEFHRDRESFEHLVMHADIASESENALRRACCSAAAATCGANCRLTRNGGKFASSPAISNCCGFFPVLSGGGLRPAISCWKTLSSAFAIRGFPARTRELHLQSAGSQLPFAGGRKPQLRAADRSRRESAVHHSGGQSSPHRRIAGGRRTPAEPIPGAVRLFRQNARVVLVRNQAGESVALCQEPGPKPGVRQRRRRRTRLEGKP